MILTPFGSRVHAPWALAIEARLADRVGIAIDVETLWSDDGIVVRFPEAERPPDSELLLPAADEVEQLVTRRLGSSALFAARFREAAARALLLPRRRPGARTPLWQQRRRSADLLQVAAGYASFPMLLETYRECLQDVFDLPGLVGLLGEIERRELRVVTSDTDTPSPFAASLLFNYVANYIYNGDAPLAERRAQLLSVDQAQLRELLGEAELRELLDSDALAELELRLQGLDPTRPLRTPDGLHDLLLRVGDLTGEELAARAAPLPPNNGVFSGPGDHPRAAMDRSPDGNQQQDPPIIGGQGGLTSWLADLEGHRRILQVPIAGQPRWIAAEDSARYRDALAVPLPSGLPDAFLEPVRDPLGDLAARFARTHGPFQTVDLAQRLGLGVATAELTLRRLEQTGRLLRGEFRPGGQGREWCDAEVLRQLRQRSLARLRREVEPVEPAALARFLPTWHGLGARRHGPDDLLEVIEQLQGAAIPFSVLESDVLPARFPHYRPGDLDQLIAAGEVVWIGLEPLGERDGRVALFLTDRLPLLMLGPAHGPGDDRPALADEPFNEGNGPLAGLPFRDRLRAVLAERGAQFFASLQVAVGSSWPNEVLDALWELVWAGEVTNDGLAALRAYAQAPAAALGSRRGRPASGPLFRSRRAAPPRGAGRWSLVESLLTSQPDPTERAHALASQLLERHGVLTREAVAAESVPGGFAVVYPVLRAMEEAGCLRRGYFVAGRGATQFALPAALDRLRTEREAPEQPGAVVLAATDPANPYGAALRWPARPDGRAPSRHAGALVVLVDGEPTAYLGRGERSLLTWPATDPARTEAIQRATAEALGSLVRQGRLWGLLLATVDGQPAHASTLAPALEAVGFRWSVRGYLLRLPVHDDEPIVAQSAAGTKSATVRAKQR